MGCAFFCPSLAYAFINVRHPPFWGPPPPDGGGAVRDIQEERPRGGAQGRQRPAAPADGFRDFRDMETLIYPAPPPSPAVCCRQLRGGAPCNKKLWIKKQSLCGNASTIDFNYFRQEMIQQSSRQPHPGGIRGLRDSIPILCGISI